MIHQPNRYFDVLARKEIDVSLIITISRDVNFFNSAHRSTKLHAEIGIYENFPVRYKSGSSHNYFKYTHDLVYFYIFLTLLHVHNVYYVFIVYLNHFVSILLCMYNNLLYPKRLSNIN